MKNWTIFARVVFATKDIEKVDLSYVVALGVGVRVFNFSTKTVETMFIQD